MSCIAQDQEPAKIHHFIGYSPGLTQIKEENLIPKVHTGILHFFSYSIQKKSDSYNLFRMHAGYGKLKTKIEDEAVSLYGQLSLCYDYQFRIAGNEKFVYYLGPYISFTSSLSEYENWDEAHAYWGNFLSFGPGNSLFISLDHKRSLITHFNLPVFGFYTRPDYYRLYANEYWTFSNITKLMNSHYHFGSLNNAFQINISTEYRTPFYKSSYFVMSFSVYYSRLKTNDGNPLKVLIPELGMGILL
jgi:hypothetical protein